MKIGLIDVDGHHWPNLALMKLSAYHKAQGDRVDWWSGLEVYDRVYVSRVFDDSYTQDIDTVIRADEVIRGGTGYGLGSHLPDEVEHIYPDYTLYPQFAEAYGFLTRGCPRSCPFCIVSEKEGRESGWVANLSEFWRGQKSIKLLDPNILACKDRETLLIQLSETNAWVDFTQGLDARMLDRDTVSLLQAIKTKCIRFAWDSEKDSATIIEKLQLFKDLSGSRRCQVVVYVLTNFDTTFEFDLYRIYTLRELGIDPYVMIYNKATAPRRVRLLQRWVNNRVIWNACARFENFDQKRA